MTALITAGQLQAGLQSDPSAWLVLDVRHDLSDHGAGRRAYEVGHIPGARYLDHEGELVGAPNPALGRHPLPERGAFAHLMRSSGLGPTTKVVAYDAQGSVFAAHLWWMLRWLGHEHVQVLDGGWQAWLEQGGAVQQGRGAAASVASAAEQRPVPAPGMPTLDTAQVLANLARQDYLVVDARAANRYRGETEPLDPVAGHIPGALNRPNSLNLQADGRFKPADQLREEFGQLLGGRAPQQVVHQCGSGITACHNLLAMELAGLPGSSLYPGSWSAWCSDPARPVATGSGD